MIPLRGAMFDISRDRVPTLDHAKACVDLCARFSANHLQWYIEHSFAYAGHEAVHQAADPFSVADLQALEEYAGKAGVEMVATINVFGHMERWLKHDAYAPLAELPDAQQRIRAGAVEPFSLNTQDPRSLALAKDLIEQMADVFSRHQSSALLGIGGDETIDLGKGKSRAAVEANGYGNVYGAFLRDLCAAVSGHGKTPLFWADIALEHPQAFTSLPDQAIALAWGYEANAQFDTWATALNDLGRRWWACPGTSCWRSLGGRSEARDGSIDRAIQACTNGASGFLMTSWGDHGHWQQWPVTAFALGCGLWAANHGRSANTEKDYEEIADLAIAEPALGPWLDQLGRIELPERLTMTHPQRGGTLINSGALFADMVLCKYTDTTWQTDLAPWQAINERLHEAERTLPAITNPLIEEEIHTTLLSLRLASNRAIARRRGGNPEDLQPLKDAWKHSHQQAWLKRSRPGGLLDSLQKIDEIGVP